MKIDVKITAWEDNESEYLKQDIIHEAALQILNEVMRNCNHYGRTFRDNLKDKIRKILTEEMSTDFKEDVKQLVVNDLSKKFNRTKQVKELKKQYEIDSDEIVKSGLAEMIRDIVKSEIKNCFK